LAGGGLPGEKGWGIVLGMDAVLVERKVGKVNRTVLARELGVTRTHVSLVLSGGKMPSLPVAARMAEKMGITLDQFWEHLLSRQQLQSVN